MVSKLQWESAQLRYETDCMVTQESLAQELGCSRQAVSKKVIKENWTKATTQALEVAKSLECSQPIAGSKFGKRSPENLARSLMFSPSPAINHWLVAELESVQTVLSAGLNRSLSLRLP